MLLDQQYLMEHASQGPAKLLGRFDQTGVRSVGLGIPSVGAPGPVGAAASAGCSC